MRRLLPLLPALALLVGCAGRTPPPPPTASPDSAPPVVTNPSPPPPGTATPGPTGPPAVESPPAEERHRLWGPFATPPRLTDGLRLPVGPGAVSLHSTVKAPTAAEAVGQVRVAGADSWQEVFEQPEGQWLVLTRIAEGTPGGTVTITIADLGSGSGTPAQATITLARQEGPTISVSRRLPDGQWAALPSGATLPPGPLTLRFRTGGGLAASALQGQFRDHRWYERFEPDRFTVLAPDLAEAHWERPPNAVMLYGGGLTGSDSIPMASDWAYHLYIGEPPRLLAVDVATGAQEVLGEVPTDLRFGERRPGARYVTLYGMDTLRLDEGRAWLFDLTSRTLIEAPFRSRYFAQAQLDASGRLVVPLDGPRLALFDPATGQATVRRSAADIFTPLSPDGRLIAGHAGGDYRRGTGGWIPPAAPKVLVIHDLLTGTERTFPWEGFARPHLPLRWLPDGRLLQGVALSDKFEANSATPYLVDVVSGQRSPWPDPVEYRQPQSGWGGTITDGAGRTHNLGPGLAVGWLDDGRALLIRWANLPFARHMMGP